MESRCLEFLPPCRILVPSTLTLQAGSDPAKDEPLGPEETFSTTFNSFFLPIFCSTNFFLNNQDKIHSTLHGTDFNALFLVLFDQLDSCSVTGFMLLFWFLHACVVFTKK